MHGEFHEYHARAALNPDSDLLAAEPWPAYTYRVPLGTDMPSLPSRIGSCWGSCLWEPPDIGVALAESGSGLPRTSR